MVAKAMPANRVATVAKAKAKPAPSVRRAVPAAPMAMVPVESVSKVNLADDDSIDECSQPGMQPEPEESADGALSVSTRVEYSALPRGSVQDVFGLVTIVASDKPSEAQEAQRQPMDLVCVLDVSGSMTGQKIRLVQDAARFIVEEADPADRISLVTFNHSATRMLRLRKMGPEGKNEASVATLRLVADGGTSIAAGLDTALQVMEQRRQRNKVSAILLLTDGQDGSTRPQIPSLLARAQRAGCGVYAFGFGSDHDASLLSEIAEQAATPFTFVEDVENIREAFAGAVGGLASVVAQRIELSIRCHVPLKAVHTGFPVQRESDTAATVTIPDIFAGERRDVLVELAVPADGEADRTLLFEAAARYVDLNRSGVLQTPQVATTAERCEEPQPEVEPDEEVSAHRERVEVTRALQEAAAHSDAGDFTAARELIGSTENKVKERKATKMSPALLLELEDACVRMASRAVWEQGGRAEVQDAAQMHKMQRCTNMSKVSAKARGSVSKMSKEMYCSSSAQKSIMKAKGDAF